MCAPLQGCGKKDQGGRGQRIPRSAVSDEEQQSRFLKALDTHATLGSTPCQAVSARASWRPHKNMGDRPSSPRLYTVSLMDSSCFEVLSEFSANPSGQHVTWRFARNFRCTSRPRSVRYTCLHVLIDSPPVPSPLKAGSPPNVIGPLIETAQCGRAQRLSIAYMNEAPDRRVSAGHGRAG